jgi:GLPGLI family protein
MLLTSCSRLDFSNQPEGIIEYDVTYVTNQSSMPTNLLPRKIILKFKANKNVTSIEGFMGMFSLSNIADLRKHFNVTLLKVMDKKFCYPGERNEAPFFFDNLSNIQISYTDETKIIAGFNCKRAIVSFSDTLHHPFDIYYTHDLPIKDPNKLTPFSSIDGVLMAFNIRLSNIEMRVVASKYKPIKIDNRVFEVPDDYKKVSKRKIVSIMNKLLE